MLPTSMHISQIPLFLGEEHGVSVPLEGAGVAWSVTVGVLLSISMQRCGVQGMVRGWGGQGGGGEGGG